MNKILQCSGLHGCVEAEMRKEKVLEMKKI